MLDILIAAATHPASLVPITPQDYPYINGLIVQLMQALKNLTRKELLAALITAHRHYRNLCLDSNIHTSSPEFIEAKQRYQDCQEEFASRIREKIWH